MAAIFLILSFVSTAAAQDYGEYNAYQEFTDGENTSRHHGFLFMPTMTYLDINEDNEVAGANPSDRSRGVVMADIKLGHTFRRGFYLGAIYAHESQNINSGSPENNRESFGASIGYLRRGWTLIASFFIHSQQEVNSATTTFDEYNKGLGYQVDFGYHFQVRPWLHIGPALTYKKFDYKEAENATTGADTDANSQHSILSPMLSFIFVLHR